MRQYDIPKAEKEIGERIRQFRLGTNLSQVAFAAKAGLDATRLASYEHGRARLNYTAAWKLITAFQIGPRWLATGEGRYWLPISVPSPAELGARPRTPFSTVFKEHLVELDSTATAEWNKRPPPEPLPINVSGSDGASRLLAEVLLFDWLRLMIERVPHAHFHQFINEIYLPARKLFRSYQKDAPEVKNKLQSEIQRLRAQFETRKEMLWLARMKEKKTPLTDVTASAKLADVRAKPRLPGLLEQLREATKERGMKSALADFLGVPLANVSQWLAGAREPSGEYVLQMEAWLELPEPKRKAK